MRCETLVHNTIVRNLIVELGQAFRDRPFTVLGPNMCVLVRKPAPHLYPDVSIVFGNELLPSIVFEVLSPDTEHSDRGPKFAHYRTVNSLQEVILVSQPELRVERYLRQGTRDWLYSETTDPGGSLEIASLGCRVPLSRIYSKGLTGSLSLPHAEVTH
jgi:Uma2 family endonuclease